MPHFGFWLSLPSHAVSMVLMLLNMIRLAYTICLFTHHIFQHYHVLQFEAGFENLQNSQFIFQPCFSSLPELTMADELPTPAPTLRSATSSELAPSAPASTQPSTHAAATDTFGANTWAERNPEKAVQGGRIRAKPTDAQKNAQKITTERNKQARVVLAQDITNLIATRKQQIEELATQHSVTIQHIQKLVDNTSHYKKPRAPNLSNALVHMKVKELNEGIPILSLLHSKLTREKLGVPEGDRKLLKEIKEAASNDPEYQNMSKDAKNEARAELQAHRNLKASAARSSNTSAARDVASTMAIQDHEVCYLI
jgi:hypothetical protein